jgi:predicted ATPase
MASPKHPPRAPYLSGAYIVEERVQDWTVHPFDLPFVRHLDVDLSSPVTLFVGENGSGKSTLLEAIAALARLPVAGGSRNELADAESENSNLASALRPKFRAKPPDAFFFRADGLADFARILDRRKADPDFIHGSGGKADPYDLYGKKSLRELSHGQSVNFLLRSRSTGGLFLFDEPEAAISPARQLLFVEYLKECVDSGRCQFILATHSPILMTIAGARILDFDQAGLPPIDARATKHWGAFASVIGAAKTDLSSPYFSGSLAHAAAQSGQASTSRTISDPCPPGSSTSRSLPSRHTRNTFRRVG